MPSRAKLIQLVHVGANKLFNDEETRRAWQEEHTGKRSCSAMSIQELDHLVKDLRKQGALTPTRRAKDPQARMIYALWADLHKKGIVRDGGNKALGRWCNKYTKKWRPEFMTTPEKQSAIEALKAWLKRVEDARHG